MNGGEKKGKIMWSIVYKLLLCIITSLLELSKTRILARVLFLIYTSHKAGE